MTKMLRLPVLPWSALILAGALVCQGAVENPFPFVLPWDDVSPGITDLSGWLNAPSGKDGTVRVGEDGHFYTGTNRIRFLGVNLSFSGGMPAKTEAEKLAGRLGKFGINVVRFHHMDTGAWPNGLRDGKAKGTGELNKTALDRLRFFFAQLKRRGIYANINLLVGRPFNAGDGLPPEIERLDWKERHIIGFFDPVQLQLQKDYARKLLAGTNPYTGLTFAADPALAFVEINNEQGLIHAWLGNDVDTLPDVFLKQLQELWNKTLQQRYGGQEKLRMAWSEGEQPLGQESLTNGAFSQQLSHWNVERHGRAAAEVRATEDVPPTVRATEPAAKAAEVRIIQPGEESWHVQLNQAGLSLQAGGACTLRFWAKANAPRSLSVSVAQGHEPWANLGLSANASVTTNWQEYRFAFTASQTDKRSRVSFGNFGGAGAISWLAGISLRPGGVTGLAPGENPAQGTVPVFKRRSFGQRTVAAQRDWLQFLTDTEDRYWQAMYRFLKDDLSVRAPITGTIVGCSTPNLMAKLDWVDTHSYWQHPRFPGRPWDSGNWIVENRSMVNERGGTLPGLALRRVYGKPHACTEYNHAAPNTYASEGFLLLAAYAALQDWDAIYVYSYAHARNEGWDSRRINGFFDIDQHPTKMATLVAAAAMFTRGDVSAARKTLAVELPPATELDRLRTGRSWDLVHAGTLGLPAPAALVHRVGMIIRGKDVPGDRLAQAPALDSRFVSDTGELSWDVSDAKRGVVTVNAPRSKAVIGYGGGKRFELGDFVLEPGQGLQNGWSAISLTQTGEGRPGRWLLTATGYAENTEMQWKNAEKSTVGRDWGRAPSRVEGVAGRIGSKAAGLRVWSLDERGQRKTILPVLRNGDGSRFSIGPEWQTLWYEVEVAGGTGL